MKIWALILALGLSMFLPNNIATGQNDPFKQHQGLMYLALVEGDADRVGKLLKTPYVEANDKIRGETLISIAIRYEHSDVVEVLLKNGADLTAEGDGGGNVLNSWANNPKLPMLEFLLPLVRKHFGADKQGLKGFINNPGSYGRAPLVSAMAVAVNTLKSPDDVDLQIVKLLTESGADVNSTDTGGYAALDYAKCYRTFGNTFSIPETSAYLAQHGAVCAKKPNH